MSTFGRAQQNAASTNTGAAKEKTTVSSALSEVINVVEEIAPKLREQGQNIDRKKLQEKIKNIGDSLAQTSTLNDSIVQILSSDPVPSGSLGVQLDSLQRELESISASIASIRSDLNLQVQANSEQTASDALSDKEQMVEKMLRDLNYSVPQNPTDLTQLQNQSKELVKKIRDASAAVSAAYAGLN
jgi:hypothetical protein